MDPTEHLKKALEAKAARRRELAALPIHEKVKILVELQKAAAPLLARQGKHVKVWELPTGEK